MPLSPILSSFVQSGLKFVQAVKKVNEHRSFVRDKIMSCCAVVLFAAYAILLILLWTNAQPEERICWFQKKTRAGEDCRGPMRRLNEGTARFVGENLNCWACSRHLMRATREANAFCSCPLQEHSSELSGKKIPKRLYRLFDRIGMNIPITAPEHAGATSAPQSRILFSPKNQTIILPQKYVCFTLFTFYFSSK